jgi:hypothetical protein
MTIPSKFGSNWATGSRQDGFYVNIINFNLNLHVYVLMILIINLILIYILCLNDFNSFSKVFWVFFLIFFLSVDLYQLCQLAIIDRKLHLTRSL